jgi:hypothetical protein
MGFFHECFAFAQRRKILLWVNRTFTSDAKRTVNAEGQYDFLRPSNPVSFVVKYD